MSDLLHDPALWFVVFAGVLAAGIFAGSRATARRTRLEEEDRRRRAMQRLNLPKEKSVSSERNDTVEEVTNTAVTKTAVNPNNPVGAEATVPLKMSDISGSSSGSDES